MCLCIAGLENANSKNYEEAFTCFLAAAQQGYSKAQFNTGVCYEKGRGVDKDKQKVRPQTSRTFLKVITNTPVLSEESVLI